MDHVETEIEPRLANGDVVISDRYVASSIAYQSLSSGEPSATVVDWIRGINARALRPDIVVVLDVPDDVAAERRAQRGGPPELFEQRELQRALALFYRDLPRHMPEDPISVVDGTGSVQAVEDRVFFECARRFGV
jgi:dTMP kinase